MSNNYILAFNDSSDAFQLMQLSWGNARTVFPAVQFLNLFCYLDSIAGQLEFSHVSVNS
jgi:hypothetical protein